MAFTGVSDFGSSETTGSSLGSGVGLGVVFFVADWDLCGVGEALGLDLVFEDGVAAGLGLGRGVAEGVGLLTGWICSRA